MAEVKGTSEFAKQAEEGLKLFKKAEDETEIDLDGATAYKDEIEKVIANLDTEIAGLAGKDNKKKRTEKEKEKSAMKVEKKYIDACKIVKGLPPPNGNFQKVTAPAKAESAEPATAAEPEEKKEEAEKTKEKKEKPAKKAESAGISKAERDELEKLKTQIIERKTELKASGMSGGQINKEEQIVQWVTRMNELKEKECPGSTTTKKDDDKKKRGKVLDSEAQKMVEEMQKDFEAYENQLRTEFKYTKKEIQADPEWQEKKAAIEKIKK